MRTNSRFVSLINPNIYSTDKQWSVQMFTIYITKAASNFGLPATRPIYQRAVEVLPDKQTAEMCLRFATMERKLGEIDRARAIYAHASQFCDPRVNANFWTEWNAFEIETGSEDTFREMLRIKRSVQAQFNTEASYIAAQMASKKGEVEQAEAENEMDVDPDGCHGEGGWRREERTGVRRSLVQSGHTETTTRSQRPMRRKFRFPMKRIEYLPRDSLTRVHVGFQVLWMLCVLMLYLHLPSIHFHLTEVLPLGVPAGLF
jgi:hypothetical protein